jgi:group I intron endonuclease
MKIRVPLSSSQGLLPDTSGIYKIECVSNGRIYIGSAVDLRNRFYKHRLAITKNRHHSRHLQNAFNKYGIQNFYFEVVEFVADKTLLIEREQFFIDSLKPEFNSDPKAGSSLGRKMTDEHKQKLRLANLGKKMTPEARAKAIAILHAHRYKAVGWHHSTETKERMSRYRQLHPPKGMSGIKHTTEAIQKITAAASKTYEFINPQGQLVVITNLASFCKDNGLIQFHLYAVAAGNRKSHKGWTKPIK